MSLHAIMQTIEIFLGDLVHTAKELPAILDVMRVMREKFIFPSSQKHPYYHFVHRQIAAVCIEDADLPETETVRLQNKSCDSELRAAGFFKFPYCSASSYQVFADKLVSSVQTTGNHGNLLVTRTIAKRFSSTVQEYTLFSSLSWLPGLNEALVN